ncbi:MAG: lipopolysaccharide biosynthesis protein [Ardenticatenaceae bacterium]|nr:lipopolysaccharide biosynthesis protein [Ardenticatenaceae bacterium]
MASDVNSKTARGVAWISGARIATKALNFFEFLILARLLAPQYFGLVAIADLAINALQLFQELGFGAALIYRKDRVREAASTAHWLIITSSTLLFLIAFAAAGPIARLFSNEPGDALQVIPILRVLAFTMVLDSISQVALVMMAKELDFGRKVIPEVVTQVGGAVLTLSLALSGVGVWSIVWGRIFEAASLAMVIWFFTRWRPAFRLDPGLAREMFAYAKHIGGSQILVFFITNIDDAFVARINGAAALGLYGLAYKLSNMPATEISKVVAQVTFPAFATVQDDLQRLRRAFLKTTRLVSLLSIPVSICIITFADDFIRNAYGIRWEGAILPLQLMGVYGLLRSVAVNMGSILKAGGKPQWLMGIATWRLATMALLLYPAARFWGIVGVSALSAAVSIADFFISAHLTNKIAATSWGDWLRIIGPPLALSLVAAPVAKIVYRAVLQPLPKSAALPMAGVCFFAVYGTMLLSLDRETRDLLLGLWRTFQARRRPAVVGS